MKFDSNASRVNFRQQHHIFWRIATRKTGPPRGLLFMLRFLILRHSRELTQVCLPKVTHRRGTGNLVGARKSAFTEETNELVREKETGYEKEKRALGLAASLPCAKSCSSSGSL